MAKEAVIVNFRSARHHQDYNQVVLCVKGVDKKAKAKDLVGKAVTWQSSAKKEIKGTITASHGNGGSVRARFERGLPGQCLGQKVKID